jgi:diguanylate cyclase (GGDEF)-like protein
MSEDGVELCSPVLVLSSDEGFRGTVEAILNEGGYVFRSVESGHQALDAVTSQYHPIVLLDWGTDGLDGAGLCEAIHEWPSSGYVYLLAAVDRDQVESMDIAGPDDYVVKPIDNTDLMARLRIAHRVVGLELALKESAEEVMLLALTDPATGVYNRSYLARQIPHEIKRARRYKRPVSVVLASVDSLDEIKEAHGPAACDAVLSSFVDCAGEKIRTGIDWVARAGENEFMIVMPETSPDNAVILAERLRRLTSEISVDHDGHTLSYTASFGVSGFEPELTDAEVTTSALLSDAGGHLKDCEDSGRNCVKGGQL